jgi:WD40 repeat protein
MLIWDVVEGRWRATFQEVEARFSPDGTTLVLVGKNADVQLWDLARGALRARLDLKALQRQSHFFHGANPWKVNAEEMSFSKDGKLLGVVVYERTGFDLPPRARWKYHGTVWDVWTGKLVLDRESERVPVFSPDGQKVVLEWDSRLDLFDVGTSRQGFAGADFPPWTSFRRFSPDGRTAIVYSPKDLLLRDVQTGRVLAPLTIPPSAHDLVSGSLFSPDGNTMVFHADHQLYLLDARTGDTQAILINPTPGGFGVPAFSPQGHHLVCQTYGGNPVAASVVIWNCQSPDRGEGARP